MCQAKRSAVLLVGDGNFSFSLSFYQCHRDIDLTTSSLLTNEECLKLHPTSHSNIQALQQNGVNVLYTADATKLHENQSVKDNQYDKIVFNFPHTGGKVNIKNNRQLLKDFFASAVEVLAPKGQIVVTLAQGQGGTPADQPIREWHDSWQVVGAAAYANLILTDVRPFDLTQYPHYTSTGFRGEDRSFYTKGAMQHTFERGCVLSKPSGETRGTVCYNGQCYETTAYISERFNRWLLRRAGHPLAVLVDKLHCLLGHSELQEKTFARVQQVCAAGSAVMLLEHCHHHPDWLYHVTPVHTHSPSNFTDHTQCTRKDQNDFTSQSYSTNKDQSDITDHSHTTNKDQSDFTDQSHSNKKDQHDVTLGKGGSTVLSRNLQQKSVQCLRGTVLHHLTLASRDMKCDGDKLYHSYGEVFRRPGAGSVDLPVQHELAGMVMSEDTHMSVKLQHYVKHTLDKLFAGHQIQVVLSQPSECQSGLCSFFQEREFMTIEAAYESENQVFMAACNQVGATGPASSENAKRLAKVTRLCKDVGFVGRLSGGEHLWGFVFNLDHLAQVYFDIADGRLLWCDLEQGETWSEGAAVCTPRGLYPLMWRHDLSFWENPNRDFSERELLDVIHSVTGDALKQILLMNRWEEPGSGRVSRCYRQIYQSSAHAISHTLAHEFQNKVRLTVQDTLGVTLR